MMKRISVSAIALLLLAGCSMNSTFVYKPGAPAAGVRKLPVKIAVLPFKDGTEDFTRRGSVLVAESLYYNLAKAGWGGVITALTPELWAKSFADDLEASGRFQAVRFLYGASELVDEDLRVEGTVGKATLAGSFGQPNDFALALRALRKADGRAVWEKRVSRTWTNQGSLYGDCGGLAIQCMIDRHKDDANRVMRELFAEAGADLARTLAPLSGMGTESDAVPQGGSPAPSPVMPESVDETIEGILKGK